MAHLGTLIFRDTQKILRDLSLDPQFSSSYHVRLKTSYLKMSSTIKMTLKREDLI